MNRARDFLLLTGLGFLFSVCGCGSPNEDSPASAPADAGLEASQDALADVFLDQVAEVSAEAGDAPEETDSSAGPVVVSVFSTSDEHGWLQSWTSAGSTYGGAANVFAAMTEMGGFDTAKDVLVSGGDNWTGAAITTVFQGKPMVDVFNYMGYAATAIGNHEFDFGVGVLKERIAESNYAYLGANLRDKGTDQQVEFALPYVIVQRQGIDIGIIGITTPATATATNPKNVADIDFAPVVESLNTVVPEVRAQGAKMVLVLAHHDAYFMKSVAQVLTERPDGIFTGHDHAHSHLVVDGIPLVGSGYNMEGFAITRFQYDPEAQVTTFLDSTFQTVKHPASNTLPLLKDQGLADLIDSWQAQLDVLLGEEIGYTATGIQLGWAMGNWVTDAWLWAYPEADVAMTNFGGLRAPIPAGVVKLQNIFDVMPFENTIYELELTGEQLRADLVVALNQCGFFGGCSLAIGGIRTMGSGNSLSVTLADGTPIDPGGVYRVLVNDYMYEAGPYPLKAQDPTPVEMGANYRDPVVNWTRQLNTSPSNPLDDHIDKEPRAK